MEIFKKIIPFLIGVALIAGGVFMFFRAGELERNCTEKTTATVVDMREDFTTDATDGMRYMYYPIIEYTAKERTITKELSSGDYTPAYRINETLTILYNPNNVEEFIVEGENQNIVWIILCGIGIAFIVAGIYLAVKPQAGGQQEA